MPSPCLSAKQRWNQMSWYQRSRFLGLRGIPVGHAHYEWAWLRRDIRNAYENYCTHNSKEI